MATVFPPEVYVTVDRIFYEHSEQLDQFTEEIERDILPALKEKKSFLDIGAGPALITRRLQPHFQQVTVVEPNPEFVKRYPKGLFNVNCQSFEECVLEQKYDFVLCSHVLYHVDLAKWPAFLCKLHERIDAGGKGLIIMLAPRGYNHEQCMRLNPNYPNSRQVLEYLDAQKIPYKVGKVTCRYKTRSFHDMHTLCRFFMIEDCFTQESYKQLSSERLEEIEAEIAQFAIKRQTGPDTFETEYEEDHIILDSAVGNSIFQSL